MMDAAYFKRWRASNKLERLHREFDGLRISAEQLDEAYKRMGYRRINNLYNRRTLG